MQSRSLDWVQLQPQSLKIYNLETGTVTLATPRDGKSLASRENSPLTKKQSINFHHADPVSGLGALPSSSLTTNSHQPKVKCQAMQMEGQNLTPHIIPRLRSISNKEITHFTQNLLSSVNHNVMKITIERKPFIPERTLYCKHVFPQPTTSQK